MNLLDKLVIPLSPEHIQLLHYISMLIFFLFVPFISMVLVGTLLSLIYKRKGFKQDNNIYIKFSKDLIETVTINKSMGIMLGIVSLITSVLIYIQLFHGANLITVEYLVWSFVFVTIGIILIYTYRYSLSFSEIFNSLDESKEDESVAEEIRKYRTNSRKLSLKAGGFGIAFLIIGTWIFTAGVTLGFFTSKWNDTHLLSVLFSWAVIARYITFLLLAAAFTGAAILFSFFYWEGGKENLNEEYKDFIRANGIALTAIPAMILPLFLLLDLTDLPGVTLSSSVFTFITLGVLLLFLGYHYLYLMYKNNNADYSLHVFLVVLLTIFATIIADQTAMVNANKPQTFALAQNFDNVMTKLTASSAPPTISGEDIYKNICSACHSFDHKVVGPPYNQTLPTFHGDVDKLVDFILHPTHPIPGYPEMPNPGLTQPQAHAVATYILQEVKKYE